MAENSKIEWTDHTWNPWIGCTQVGPPCDRCYAMVMMDHRYGRVKWGAGEDRIRTSKGNWDQPFKWDRAAMKAGRIDTVFCLSLGDIWDNEIDPLWRSQAIDVMKATPNLLYLLLSKRIGNAVKMCDPEDSHAPDWIICGGESGSSPREMNPQWARDLRDGARRFGRAFFMKQMTGKKPIPEDLMIRQFPNPLRVVQHH